MKITETNLQFKNALTKRSKTEKIVTHHAAAKVCDAYLELKHSTNIEYIR